MISHKLVAWLPVVAIALALSGCVSDSTPAENSADLLPWHDNRPDALQQAAATNKPILLDAYATWCGPCQQFEKTTLSDPAVQERLKDYVLLKLNVDKFPAEAREYGVRFLPTVIILDSTGEQMQTHPGMMSPRQFIAFLDQFEAM